MKCPYVDGYHFESDSGKSIQMKTIWGVANKALSLILSELPEEARTHDVVELAIEEIGKQLNGANVSL